MIHPSERLTSTFERIAVADGIRVGPDRPVGLEDESG